ncbi:hypothetical protein IL306_015041 [Fusarium sp. DS 682]|nr:hypothetical protein IL306_015041 [Fusarium sp. DS 682]
MLERCRSLKKLTMALSVEAPTGYITRNLGMFGSVLRECGQNLTELAILTKGPDTLLLKPDSRIGSLKELTSLTHLSISRLNLVGPVSEDTEQKIMLGDALPQSLEFLTLEPEVELTTWWRVWAPIFNNTERQIIDMLKFRQHPPNLKRVHMKLPEAIEAQNFLHHTLIEFDGWHIERIPNLSGAGRVQWIDWLGDVNEVIATATQT